MLEGMRRFDELDAVMQEGLTEQEQEALCRALLKMRDNLFRFMESKEVNAHD